MAKRSRQEKKQKARLSEKEKNDASAITQDVSKPSFDKQQRREVQQAIELGIERYKRQHKSKARDFDKAQKKQKKQLVVTDVKALPEKKRIFNGLPWALLVISWLGFIVFWMMQQ